MPAEIFEPKPACVSMSFERAYCGSEVVSNPEHPNFSFCSEIDRHTRWPMTQEHEEELLLLGDD